MEEEQITNEELFKNLQNEEEVTQEAPANSFAGIATPDGETRTAQTNETPKKDILEKIENDVEESKSTLNSDGFDYEVEAELSDTEAEDIKIKTEDLENDFIIESAEILTPQLKDADGNFIAPEPFNKEKPDSKKGYKTKLKLKFKDTSYASFVPNIKWFINIQKDGSKKLMLGLQLN